MLISKYQGIGISGISAAVPPDVVTVDSFRAMFGDENVEKFMQMTGVTSFRRARPRQTASDLAFLAARKIIEGQDIDRQKIGILVFVTQKPDYRVPATAYVLHKRLGLSIDCLCLDINLACSGFVYGLSVVAGLLQNSTFEYGLLLAGDTSTRTISPYDKTMTMLFGDCGSACLLRRTNSIEDVMSFAFRSDGNRYKAIITPAGGYKQMLGQGQRHCREDDIMRSDYEVRMNGMDVFAFSITDVPDLIGEFLKEQNLKPDDYSHLILHQANVYIMKQIARRIKFPWANVPLSIDKFGNTSSSSIPLTITENSVGLSGKNDDRILICGFGAGLSWACSDLSINQAVIHQLIESDDYYLP